MRLLLLSVLTITSLQAQAFVETDCKAKLTAFSRQFLKKNAKEIFNTKKENLSFRFLSFKNTTPGSFDQQYEVMVDVTWPSKIDNYSNGTTLKLTMYAPFICDRLELRGIVETDN